MTEQKRKLSELIREGAKLRPQCISGDFYDHDDEPKLIGSCAFGAAFEAAIGMTAIYDVDGWYDVMATRVEKLPDGVTFDRLTMRNDEGATREEIADWLEAAGY